MCIICNVSDPYSEAPDKFLYEFSKVSYHMKLAQKSMLDIIAITPDIERKKQYKKTHKSMVRHMREWNKLEHTREIKVI